jgi:uncharacterized protein (TIGR03118 family)
MSAPFNRIAAGIVSPSGPIRAFAGKVATAFALIFAALSAPSGAQIAGAYKVTNLRSDGSVPANFTDPNFINPWAISVSGTWWISAQVKGYNYVVSATPNPGSSPFKVIVPPATGTGTGSPAGSVTTAGATGMILSNGTKASFLFSTLDGTISGWNLPLGTSTSAPPVTLIAINNHAAGAIYPGMAIINTAAASYILVANFGTANTIEVYDGNFKPAQLPGGSFTDPNLPAGYAPFSVHVINGKVYVAYAMRTSSTPYSTVDALGNGAVSVFDTTGKFIARIATGGNLDSPWGVAIAPANFGIFGGAILIGNFGNGLINAYDSSSFSFLGQLTDANAAPLTYATLWELLPGGTTVGNSTSVSGGDLNTVYFTAGLAGAIHGLFGAITNDTSAGSPSFALSTATSSLTVASGGTAQTTISIEPIYGFSGNVNLACSGLPPGAACIFSPIQLDSNSTGATPTLYGVSILTRKNMGLFENTQGRLKGIAYALLLPFASIIVFRRRRLMASLGLFSVLLLCGIGLIGLGVAVGCSSSAATTPAGTSTVSITATAPALSMTRTATVQLIVQ